MDEEEIEAICATQIRDASLKLALSFGIGLHHAVLILLVYLTSGSPGYRSQDC
jgi:hypothetical protein